MQATTGTASSSKPAPSQSTDTLGNTGRAVKVLRVRELLGVPWIMGVTIDGKDSTQRPMRMTRLRVSVLIEGQAGSCEVPDAMIKSIEYAP